MVVPRSPDADNQDRLLSVYRQHSSDFNSHLPGVVLPALLPRAERI